MDEDIYDSVFGIYARLGLQTERLSRRDLTPYDMLNIASRLRIEAETLESNARTLQMRLEFKAARP